MLSILTVFLVGLKAIHKLYNAITGITDTGITDTGTTNMTSTGTTSTNTTQNVIKCLCTSRCFCGNCECNTLEGQDCDCTCLCIDECHCMENYIQTIESNKLLRDCISLWKDKHCDIQKKYNKLKLDIKQQEVMYHTVIEQLKTEINRVCVCYLECRCNNEKCSCEEQCICLEYYHMVLKDYTKLTESHTKLTESHTKLIEENIEIRESHTKITEKICKLSQDYCDTVNKLGEVSSAYIKILEK